MTRDNLSAPPELENLLLTEARAVEAERSRRM